MSVTNIYQLTGGRDLNVTVDGIKTASLVYGVVTDAVMTLPAILSDPLTSVIGGTYPSNPDMYINNVKINDMEGSVRTYRIELSYTNERELEENPLNEPSRVSVGGEYYQAPVFTDRNGQALVTSSGEYPEGLFEDHVQINFTVSKNVPSVPGWLLTAAGAVNISGFAIRGLSIAAEKARLGIVTASDELTRNGFLFYKLSIPISFRAKGWKTEYMDRGYWKKDPATPTKRAKIYLDDGSVPSSPVPLDGSGNVLANPGPGNIVILKKDTKIAFDFNSLPLT